MAAEDVQLALTIFADAVHDGALDMAVAIEDDELWKRNQERIAPDVAVRFVTPPGGGVEVMRQDYLGIDGLREGWRAWLEPWDRFELQIDEALDVGDGRVLVLVRTLARLRESTTEVPDRAASAKARLASSGSRNSSVRIGTPSRKVLSIAIWTSVAAPLPLPASLTTVRIPRSRARPKPVSRSA